MEMESEHNEVPTEPPGAPTTCCWVKRVWHSSLDFTEAKFTLFWENVQLSVKKRHHISGDTHSINISRTLNVGTSSTTEPCAELNI
jgi:hypothetical protein